MPVVDGKHFPYTKEGMKAAKKAKKASGKNYSKEHIAIAKKLMS